MNPLQTARPELVSLPEGLTLTDGTLSLRADFSHMIPRIRPAVLGRELLVRAARIKKADGALTAVDATAGLGEDALLLAAHGFFVQLYERDPVIEALLRDALRRARDIPELAQAVSRMEVLGEDSIEALSRMAERGLRPDLVFLDPMFPARQKSALVKKKFQLLQQLEQPCADEDRLLEAAFSVRPRKIVVKRPAKGPFLAGRRPDHSLSGKAVRYDCFVL